MMFFLLQYYRNEETGHDYTMSEELITNALRIRVRRILTFEIHPHGFIVMMSTSKYYRPSYVRRVLTATSYNLIDKKGLQIRGEDGLKIYTRSKRDQYDEHDMFSTYMCVVENTLKKEGKDLNEMLKVWPAPAVPTASEPDPDDQLAISNAQGSSSVNDIGGNDADSVDNVDDENDVDVDDDGELVPMSRLTAANKRIAELEQELRAARATIIRAAAAGGSTATAADAMV